jgi:Domain of unknown function (DUF4440)
MIRLLLASLTIAGLSPLGAQVASTSQARDRVLAIYSMIGAGDTASLRAHLSRDLRWTVGVDGSVLTRDALLAAAAPARGPAPRFDVDSVHERRAGGATIVDYVRTDHRPLGSTELVTRWRALAVFTGDGSRWQLLRQSLTWLVHPAQPIALDSAAMQAYVGRYQIAAGYVDSVHWENGHLVATATGQSAGARLVPVSTNAFSPDGFGALIVFERDAAGRVVGYVQGYPDGSVFRAPRLP